MPIEMETETKRTDKTLLMKGIKFMAVSLLLMFGGPTLFYIVTTNKGKPFYEVLLIIAILICIVGVYLAFKGIQTIMKSMFGERSSSN
jgi:hypothetical protein